MIAIVCPGQGAQKPGLLNDWLELDGVPEHLAELSEAAGLDLRHYGTEADEETIRDTAVAQPLIVACGLIAGRLLKDRLDGRDDLVFAGHSVGEITAAALSGALTEKDAMTFVHTRADAMAAAAATVPTGMSAVLSPKEDEVREAIEAAGLTAANSNGGGQIVAAGTLEQLEAFAAEPPARARVIPLKVAGAFHTQHMSPALAPLRDLVGSLAPQDPSSPLLSNFDGQPVTSGAANLESLVEQVC
ncbi:ACP S-malonyltransferase, partial [Kocuria coralli]